MSELLDTMEGIFWKFIRGQGLAYSCFLSTDVESGLISFTIYQSPDAYKAVAQAKMVIDQLASGEVWVMNCITKRNYNWQACVDEDWDLCRGWCQECCDV